jgi:hypothetical protein
MLVKWTDLLAFAPTVEVYVAKRPVYNDCIDLQRRCGEVSQSARCGDFDLREHRRRSCCRVVEPGKPSLKDLAVKKGVVV